MITSVLRDPRRDHVTGASSRQRISQAIDALKFLPLDRWDLVIELALDLAGVTPGDGPDDVIREASIQCPHLLTPHFRRIWDLKVNAGRDHEMAAWRGADETELHRLAAVVDSGEDPVDVRRAYAGLLESRSPLGLQLALERMDSADVQPAELPKVGRFDEVFSAWDTPGTEAFQSVGHDLENGTLRPLCAGRSFHLRFNPDYVDVLRSHPTWFDIGEPIHAATFGGSRSATCLLKRPGFDDCSGYWVTASKAIGF